MTLPQSAHVTLETLIDRHGLLTIVKLLAIICGEKAEHIAVNWQDASLSKHWDKAARLIDKLEPQLAALKLS